MFNEFKTLYYLHKTCISFQRMCVIIKITFLKIASSDGFFIFATNRLFPLSHILFFLNPPNLKLKLSGTYLP